MRTTSLITFSIPPALARASEAAAKKQHMTRSELLRMALRRYLEEQNALVAVAQYEKERTAGKLKVLKGSLADLMK